MTGGTAQQTKRRSMDTNNDGDSGGEDNEEGWCVDVTVNEDEIINNLKNPSTYGQGEVKKDVLRRLVEIRVDLLHRINSVCQHLHDSADLTLPLIAADVKNLSVVDTVKKLIKMRTILQDFVSSEDVGAPTTLLRKCLAINETLNNMYNEAHDNVEKKKQTEANSKFVKLTTEEQNRQYNIEGSIPTDPVHRKCPFCHHDFVDEPDSNKNALVENEQKLADYTKLKNEFEEAKMKKKLPLIKDGKTYHRVPAPPKLKPAYLQCHCSQLRAVSLNTDIGSTCLIRCLDPNGKRYERDAATGKSTCPICVCQCNIAFEVGAFQDIRHTQLARSSIDTAKLKAASAAETQKKITDGMMQGFDTTAAVLVAKKIRESNRILCCHGLPPFSNDEEAHIETEGWNRSAYNLASAISCDDDAAYLLESSEAMGRPTTLTTVDGQLLSTRSLSHSLSNHRTKNNNLAAPSIAKKQSKKMSRLRPHQDEFEDSFEDSKMPAVASIPQSSTISLTTTPSVSQSLLDPSHVTPTPLDPVYVSTPGSAYQLSGIHQHGAADDSKDINLVDGFEQVTRVTANQIVNGTLSRMCVDVDNGDEYPESYVNKEAAKAGKRMRHMAKNQDQARMTCKSFDNLGIAFPPETIAQFYDETWEKEFSPEKRGRD